MQESRLFQILYLLLAKGRMTACDLARELEVSTRTIYRDIDRLSGAGIPIYAETGRNGGICLMDHFTLDKAMFSETEKQEIVAALQSLHAVNQGYLRDTWNKLSALFQIQSDHWLEVDFSRWGSEQKDNQTFQVIQTAILEHRAIAITYAGTDETITKRTIYPLRLSYKAKEWYVKAYCTYKQDYRIFKLTRILHLTILSEHFRDYTYPSQNNEPSPAMITVTLRFPKEMAYRVYDEFDATIVTKEENKDLLVTTSMPEDAWLVGFLLSFGTKVEVIAPSHLKVILAQQAKEIYEKNKP